jgi:hypothetical protein
VMFRGVLVCAALAAATLSAQQRPIARSRRSRAHRRR